MAHPGPGLLGGADARQPQDMQGALLTPGLNLAQAVAAKPSVVCVCWLSSQLTGLNSTSRARPGMPMTEMAWSMPPLVTPT